MHVDDMLDFLGISGRKKKLQLPPLGSDERRLYNVLACGSEKNRRSIKPGVIHGSRENQWHYYGIGNEGVSLYGSWEGVYFYVVKGRETIMKEYYQNKSHGYRLPYPIYKKMIKTIEAYEFYREIEKQGKSTEKSVMNPEKAAANVASAGMYVAAIEQALTSYVREEYRPAIFNHIVEGLSLIHI